MSEPPRRSDPVPSSLRSISTAEIKSRIAAMFAAGDGPEQAEPDPGQPPDPGRSAPPR
ncbi:hypothetical protein R1CP_36995 (plasmid) [Rhodococcus opacus]|uniref:Uncharacterized protein n=1 Tax=Rhodococcus opacus TaxID=37919 RepID=A0A1B1KHB4_RHOOP|nr:hypothetical protein R1CP_36995 [Rhodococcus opacus]